jgi:hypothetical protein
MTKRKTAKQLINSIVKAHPTYIKVVLQDGSIAVVDPATIYSIAMNPEGHEIYFSVRHAATTPRVYGKEDVLSFLEAYLKYLEELPEE